MCTRPSQAAILSVSSHMPSLKFTPNCPLHPETEHMFDDRLIGKMNVARISFSHP